MARANATRLEVRGSGDGSHILPHGGADWGKEPEVSEHVARANATHPEVRGSGDGALILPHGGDGWGKNPR